LQRAAALAEILMQEIRLQRVIHRRHRRQLLRLLQIRRRRQPEAHRLR
jgi:hypothetical protein